MQNLQDEAIIQLILQGDTNAYAVLIERYQHFVFTLVKKITNNQEDSEEITQDVFIKAYQSLSKYKGDSKFSTWLYTIARNTALSHGRKQTLPISYESDASTIESADHHAELTIDKKSSLALLNVAIKRLAADEQIILTLFYIQEQTIAEMAQIMELSTINIKVKLYRARKKLREILDRDYNNEFAEYRTTNN